METEIKAILIQKLKEKNVRKFNGYTLGLHANHIANALLRKKGIKKGSDEYNTQLSKLKQLVKDIHKDLPAQAVDASKKVKAEIPPAQLARETSSVETEAPAPKATSELASVKAELKKLKALIGNSKTIKTELANKIQEVYKRYKEMKSIKAGAKKEIEAIQAKEAELDKKVKAFQEKRKTKALSTAVEALRKNVKPKSSKPRKLTSEEFKARMKEHREAVAKKKAEEAEAKAKEAPAPEPVKEHTHEDRREYWEDKVLKRFKYDEDAIVKALKVKFLDTPLSQSEQMYAKREVDLLKKMPSVSTLYVKYDENDKIVDMIYKQYEKVYKYAHMKTTYPTSKGIKTANAFRPLPGSEIDLDMLDFGEYTLIK